LKWGRSSTGKFSRSRGSPPLTISAWIEVLSDYCSKFGHCTFEPTFEGSGAIRGVARGGHVGWPPQLSIQWIFDGKKLEFLGPRACGFNTSY